MPEPSLVQAALAALPAPVANHVGEALLAISYLVREWRNSRTAKERAQAHDTKLTREMRTLKDTVDAAARATERSLLELRHFIVGPDGTNGLQSDVRGLQEEVKKLHEHERERLLHGPYDNRRGR